MKKRTIFLVVLLALVAATSVYVGSTYAKYVSSYGGTTSVEVAAWDVKVNDYDFTTSAAKTDAVLNCTFAPATTSNVAGDRVAPGRSCYIDVAIDPTGTEVAINYSITFGTATGGTLPSNMVATAKSHAGTTYSETDSSVVTLSSGVAAGTIALPGTAGSNTAMTATEAITVRYFLSWPYETDAIATNDPEDTTDGISASTLSIPVTVTLTQVAP